MLDAKLLMYLPFLDVMSNSNSSSSNKGCVFFTASDDVETFNVSAADLEEIGREWGDMDEEVPRMVSLAHPSSLQVGTGTLTLYSYYLGNNGETSVVFIQRVIL